MNTNYRKLLYDIKITSKGLTGWVTGKLVSQVYGETKVFMSGHQKLIFTRIVASAEQRILIPKNISPNISLSLSPLCQTHPIVNI